MKMVTIQLAELPLSVVALGLESSTHTVQIKKNCCSLLPSDICTMHLTVVCFFSQEPCGPGVFLEFLRRMRAQFGPVHCQWIIGQPTNVLKYIIIWFCLISEQLGRCAFRYRFVHSHLNIHLIYFSNLSWPIYATQRKIVNFGIIHPDHKSIGTLFDLLSQRNPCLLCIAVIPQCRCNLIWWREAIIFVYHHHR